MVQVWTRSCHADLMRRLIALTEERGASVAWINPEHIVSVRPVATRAGDRASVLAEIKLAGMLTERFVVDRGCAAEHAGPQPLRAAGRSLTLPIFAE